MRFVERNGTFNVEVGGRSKTPILELPRVTKGNTLKVMVNFMAKTAGQANSGFTYSIQATNPADVVKLSAQEGIVQGNAGFQAATKIAFFEAKVTSPTGIEDVDFEVIFQKGDLDGQGEISDFLLIAEIVSLEP